MQSEYKNYMQYTICATSNYIASYYNYIYKL